MCGYFSMMAAHTIDIYEMVAIFWFFKIAKFQNLICQLCWHWYSISVDTRKTGDRNFEGVGNWKFFRMIDIYEMVAIFWFFHNGQHWYSVSIDTQKTGNPNFEGVSNMKFFHIIDNYEMAAIFWFFDNGQHQYSISVNTQKTRDPNFWGVSNWTFFVRSIFMKCQPFFNFFIMADTDILFLSTLGKL